MSLKLAFLLFPSEESGGREEDHWCLDVFQNGLFSWPYMENYELESTGDLALF